MSIGSSIMRAANLESLSADWLRQLPRYIVKSEERPLGRSAAEATTGASGEIILELPQVVGAVSDVAQETARAALDPGDRRAAKK